MANWLNALVRKKPIEKTAITHTRLERCLSTLDLTMLGCLANFIVQKIVIEFCVI